MIRKAVKWFLAKLFRVLFRVRIEGLNRKVDSSRLMIIANHESFMDGLLVGLYLPFDPVFVVHTGVTRKWFFRLFVSLADHLSVDPTNPMATKSASWTAWGCVAVGYAILAIGHRPEQATRRVPQAVVAVVLALCTAGLVIAALVVGTSSLGGAQPAVVATLRTGVMALLVVALAGGARGFGLVELGWFVYPLLALGALKLVAEDLGRGRPTTLFFSLVLYGGALILAPRLLRRGE